MVQHATPQFTPQQILDAARRAEAEGKSDLAVQFYRHLVEQYGYTSEAVEARNALGRLGSAWAPQVWSGGGGASPGSGRPRRRYPVHRDYYRVGRLLARLFSACGWLAMLGALALAGAWAGANLLRIPQLRELDLGAVSLLQIPGALLGGALLVFVGQAARALFDQANATRELVAIERAKAAGDSA